MPQKRKEAYELEVASGAVLERRQVVLVLNIGLEANALAVLFNGAGHVARAEERIALLARLRCLVAHSFRRRCKLQSAICKLTLAG